MTKRVRKRFSPFWQKPAGIALIAGGSSIIACALGFLLGYYFIKKNKSRK